MDSFVMMGQSNMAGRGFIKEVEPIINKKLFMLRNGRWQEMRTPVNPDRSFSGVSLAESFAYKYAQKTGNEIGLIPCADGGTTLEHWKVGGLLYTNAVMQTTLAMRTSSVKGILWHQGESDCCNGRVTFYKENFETIIDSFRKECGLENVPVIVGELGEYLKDNAENEYKNYVYINEVLNKICDERKDFACVSSKGLVSKPDLLHFNAKSARIFGERYFKEYEIFMKKMILFLYKNE